MEKTNRVKELADNIIKSFDKEDKNKFYIKQDITLKRYVLMSADQSKILVKEFNSGLSAFINKTTLGKNCLPIFFVDKDQAEDAMILQYNHLQSATYGDIIPVKVNITMSYEHEAEYNPTSYIKDKVE